MEYIENIENDKEIKNSKFDDKYKEILKKTNESKNDFAELRDLTQVKLKEYFNEVKLKEYFNENNDKIYNIEEYVRECLNKNAYLGAYYLLYCQLPNNNNLNSIDFRYEEIKKELFEDIFYNIKTTSR